MIYSYGDGFLDHLYIYIYIHIYSSISICSDGVLDLQNSKKSTSGDLPGSAAGLAQNMAGLAFPVPNVRPAVETVKQALAGSAIWMSDHRSSRWKTGRSH